MSHGSPSETFLHEADDLLAVIEETALEVQESDDRGGQIDQLFRAFHTIKGSGAMFGFDAVAAFTHHVETVLDQVRDGRVDVSSELVTSILAAKDHIKGLLDATRGGAAVDPKAGDKIIAGLSVLVPKSGADAEPVRMAIDAEPESGATAARMSTFRIRFVAPRDLLMRGTDPGSLLDQLRALGRCTVEIDVSRVPDLSALVADECHFAWNITLETDSGVDAIRDVFIFVEDGAELSIECVDAERADTAEDDDDSPAEVAVAGSAEPPSRPVSAARPEVSPNGGRSAARDAAVRVSSERLDRLVTLVGELVTNQSRLVQVAARAGLADLDATSEELERLVSELRDTVLGIRMMPIGSTFGRFKRLVHDLSRDLGKEIDLVTEGAETELDKTVLDQLGDPLVHLIRNSIDHGIELPDVRVSSGKPRRGCIRLVASHEGSHVVVAIEDDGRGLDAGAIRAKAVEKRLIASDATLSEQDTFNLIFLPGFSTAKAVTSVSGRGVGMDVVRRQLDALHGSIRISSQPGSGTTISLTLPLTLAIIDGLLVEIGRSQFIIPMTVVSENVEITGSERSRNNGRNSIEVRGELVSYIRLRELFAVDGPDPDVEMVVLVHNDGQRVGVVVDRVLGSHQTVIQSLGSYCRNIAVVSGATIMGDGRVALILDIDCMVRMAARFIRDSAHPGLEVRGLPVA